MAFHPTEYFAPSNASEVCELLAKYGKQARTIAGGTAMYELAKRGLATEVRQLISLRNLPLTYAKHDEAGFHIGATMTLARLIDELGADPMFRVVSDALHEIRPMQVRSVATIGGEVCTSLPLLDLPPALLAADARVVVQGMNGKRTVPLEQFLVDFFLNALKADEFLIEVLLPNHPERCGSAFLKFGRTAYDFNLVNVAVSLSFGNDSKCADARIYLGGVGRTPLHASAVENSIKGERIGKDLILKAVAALGEFRAIPQIHGNAQYKRDVGRVLLRDCIGLAVERAEV